MNIGIDIDDTICNTYETTIPYLKNYMENKLGIHFKMDLSSMVDYYNLASRFNITREEDMAFWYDYFVKIAEEVKPKENAVEVIRKLKEEGHNIYLVTARFTVPEIDIKGLTKQWLVNNGIVFDKLIINSHNKLEIAQRENIDLFFDDSIRNCSMLSEGNIETYMYSTEYNEIFKSDKVKRVSSWDEFYRCIKEEK